MKLTLEQLESRILLAVPAKPFGLDLDGAGDSGSSNTDNITNVNSGTIEFIAEKNSAGHVYNNGIYLGDATGTGDTLFYETGNAVIIEAERGFGAGAMTTAAVQAGYQGTGYIVDTAATSGNPGLGGTATYSFYISTAGTYYVHARVYFKNGSENSFFINIDDTWTAGETGPSIWDDTFNSWHMSTAATVVNGGVSKTWALAAGWHTLEIHGREQDAMLDRIVIDRNAANPVDPGGTETVYETFEYTFQSGAVNDLFGSAAGTTNSITVKAENGDGTSVASDALVIIYDNVAPNTPFSIDLDASDDSGSSSTDNITNMTNVEITGYADPNSIITVNRNGFDVGTTTTSAAGVWSYTLALLEGANDVFVTASDLAGNESSAGTTLTITLDTVAPITATAPDLDTASDTGYAEYPGYDTDNLTHDTTPTFIGTAGSVDANAQVSLRKGAVTLATTTAAANGSWSITLDEGDLDEGSNTLSIRVTDTAGNTRDSGNLIVTLDTTAAAPAAAPDLDAGSDTGSSSADNITSSTAPTFTGPAAAVPNNSKVYLRVNGVNKRSTTTTPDGSYSIDLLAGDLSEGINLIDIYYIDPAGNTSPDSTDLTITLDTILATPAAPDLRAASDTGTNTDNITSEDEPWFDGYAEPGATVQLFVGATGKGTAAANASTGAWSIQLASGDLASGSNSITVQVTDAAGNIASSAALAVTYDSGGSVPDTPRLQAASDTGSSNSDGITYLAASTVYGSVADGNEVEPGATVHVRTNKNGGGWNVIGTTVADGSGNWSYTFDGVDDLSVGTNLVDIYITDLSNNASADSADLTITLDTSAAVPGAAPNLTAASDTGSSNTDNITSDTTPTFSGPAGTVEGSATVWIRVDGTNTRSGTAAANGSYSITLLAGSITAGTHVIDIIQIDTAGNISSDSANLSITLDTSAAAPGSAPDLSSATDTGSSNSDNITNSIATVFTGAAGSVEANSTVYVRVGGVNKRSGTATAAGAYSITMQAGDLTIGNNTIDIYYVDVAGNTSADSANLTVQLDTSIADPAQPDLASFSDTGSSSTDNITTETRPTIQGAAGSVEGSSTIQIWLDTPTNPDTQVATVSAAADGSWSYTFGSVSPLEEGTNIIHIVAVDTAGNVSNASANLTITVDFSTGAEGAPDLDAASDTGLSNSDNITSDTTPTITGTCPSGAPIKLRTNESTIVSFTANGLGAANPVAGQWSYTYPAPLSAGTITVDFLTIDTAKNTSDWSLDLVFTLDTSIQTPSTPDLAVADDTGTNSADNITYRTTPTLSGTAEANGRITTLTVGAVDHAVNIAVAANGTWSYTLPAGWLTANAANSITVVATDVAGNVSIASAALSITLDTLINAPSAPDLTAATDTGSSSTDNITSHANPRITGTSDADCRIDVRIGGVIVGTTYADNNGDGTGDWSFTFASDDLSEGSNIVDVLATDTAGNSIDSANLTITIETAINIPDALDLTDASDKGNSSADNLTYLKTSTITGTADASCTIYIRVNGTVIGNTTSNGLGNWSYTFDGIDDLIEGTNIIDAYARDSSGNVSDFSSNLVIVLDTAVAVLDAPTLQTASDTGSSDSDRYTNDETPTITGACETGATVTISLNGNDAYATVTDAADGSSDGRWTYTFPAVAGLNGSAAGIANTIKVKQQDPAGNVGSAFSSTLTITYDNSASTPTQPDLLAVSDSGDSDTDNLTNIPNVTITGTVEVNSSLQLYINRGAGPVLMDTISESLISSGIWSYTLSTGLLASGVNQITVVATDKAGNISASSAGLSITLDRTIAQPGLPDLAASSDTGDSSSDEVTSDETPTFSGVADPNTHITIRVDGASINTVNANAAGVWTYTFAQGEIRPGVQRIDVIAEETAGNVAIESEDLTLWLNVQPTQPAAPNLQTASDSGRFLTDNLTNVTIPVIDGKADPAGRVEIYVDNQLKGTTTANANGFWTYTFSLGALAEGQNVITVITEDTSGLRSAVSMPLTITLDTTSPDAPLPDLQPTSDTGASDSDNYTSDTTPTIEGTTEAGALVDLYLNNNPLTQLTATAAGFWSYTFAPDTLQNNANEIYILITDQAGNISLSSPVLTVTIDVEQINPDTPAVTPDTDTGTLHSDALTKNPEPIISGQVKPNSTVAVLVSGQIVGSVTADSSGAWTYQFASGQLVEGVNPVEVLSTDPVGNTARSSTLALTLDTTSPILYNYFPRGTHVHTTKLVELYLHGADIDTLAASDVNGYLLKGSGGDGSFNDGNEWIIPVNSITVDTLTGLVQLNTAITLTDDDYQLRISTDSALLDQAGNPAVLNVSASLGETLASESDLILYFSIDTAGPPAPGAPLLSSISDSGVSDSDGITNVSNVLIQLNAQPDVSVELICNGWSAGFANETQPGVYQIYIENSLIRQGENLLLARAYDSLGNSSELSPLSAFTYDAIAPQVVSIIVDSLWVNSGPTQISVVFNANDIDPDTLNSNCFRILAAGGDGSFDEGNEIEFTVTAVSYDAASGTAILTLPQSVTGISLLTSDFYRLMVKSDSAIQDLAGNTFALSASADFQVVPAITVLAGHSYKFITAQGDRVTITLTGTGQAILLLGEDLGTGNLIERIQLRNTDENSRLKISTDDRDGYVTIGELLSDGPLCRLNLADCWITDKIVFEGSLRQFNIGKIGDAADVQLISPVLDAQSGTKNALQIQAGDIGNQVVMTVTGHLASLTSQSFVGGSFTAASAGKISIERGNLGANIHLLAGNLNSLRVGKGNLTGSVSVAQHIQSVKVAKGSLTGSFLAESIDSLFAAEFHDTLIRAVQNIDSVKGTSAENLLLSTGLDLGQVKFKQDVINASVSAGTDIHKISIQGDALDSLFLSGADLGPDGELNGNADAFTDGNILSLSVKGQYLRSTAAAAVNPGDDQAFFTADDHPASSGSIRRVKFSRNSIETTSADHDFGLIASGFIPSFRAAGQKIQAPFQLDQFRIEILE